MNKKLSDWASLAEVVSSIAVVITLVVLIVGVNANTTVTRAAVYQDSLDRLNDFETIIVQDSDLTRIWNHLFEGTAVELQRLEYVRLVSLIRQVFRVYENAYYDYQYALIGDREWVRFERSMCRIYSLVRAQDVSDQIELITTAEFFEYLETSCQLDTG